MKRRRPKQLSLLDTSRKKRRAARTRARSRVPHRKRPLHADAHPVHITLRGRRELPSFRNQVVRQLVMTLLAQVRAWSEKANGKDSFQLLEASIQDDHIHLMIEATDKEKLSSGMRSFIIRFAKRLNRILGRVNGKVWADRYHRHDLKTPREVRTCLVYIFANWKKHSLVLPRYLPLCDPYSSSGAFEGWTGTPMVILPGPWPRFAPRTWLLEKGWRRAGVIRPTDCPQGTIVALPAVA